MPDDMDVIDTTAEALPLELLNPTNKQLTAQLSQLEQQLEEQTRATEDQRKRLQFIQEHLANVRAEIVNTQSLTESARREVESDANMQRLLQRECGRLTQRKGQLAHKISTATEQQRSVQERVLRGQSTLDALREAGQFNETELQQWDEARRQKERDELAMAEYTKQDNVLLRTRRRTLEQHEESLRTKRAELAHAITATAAAQVLLQHSAQEYTQAQAERHGVLNQWSRVVASLSQNDQSIAQSAERYAQQASWTKEKQDQCVALRDKLTRAQAETSQLQRRADASEAEGAHVRGVLLPSWQNELRTLQEALEQSQADSRQLREQQQSRTSQLREKHERARHLQEVELAQITAKHDATKQRVAAESNLARDEQEQRGLLQQLHQRAQAALRHVESQLQRAEQRLHRDALPALHVARAEKQNELLQTVAAAAAQLRQMGDKVHLCEVEAQSRQRLLYGIAFHVQQMEKRLRRARGERSAEETAALRAKVTALQQTHTQVSEQQQHLAQQRQRLLDLVRREQSAQEQQRAKKDAVEQSVLDISRAVQCALRQRKLAIRQREDALIAVDTLSLLCGRLGRQRKRGQSEMSAQAEQQMRWAELAHAKLAEWETACRLAHVTQNVVAEEWRVLRREWQSRKRVKAALRRRHGLLLARMGGEEDVCAGKSERDEVGESASEDEQGCALHESSITNNDNNTHSSRMGSTDHTMCSAKRLSTPNRVHHSRNHKSSSTRRAAAANKSIRRVATSQAARVVAAAKEREALQMRGDALDGRLRRASRELRGLAKTVAMLRASNQRYRRCFDTVDVSGNTNSSGSISKYNTTSNANDSHDGKDGGEQACARGNHTSQASATQATDSSCVNTAEAINNNNNNNDNDNSTNGAEEDDSGLDAWQTRCRLREQLAALQTRERHRRAECAATSPMQRKLQGELEYRQKDVKQMEQAVREASAARAAAAEAVWRVRELIARYTQSIARARAHVDELVAKDVDLYGAHAQVRLLLRRLTELVDGYDARVQVPPSEEHEESSNTAEGGRRSVGEVMRARLGECAVVLPFT